MPLSPGVRLGPYEILAPLGAGGMGEVYRARDTRLQREVAVKVLPAAMASDAGALRRMEQEARAVAALNHPNLLSVYDIGTSPEGVPFLVTELLEGETLRRRLAEGGVSQRKAVEWALQIAHGLAAAHDKGIVHRDLKPDNIFVCADGRVKILDFGLAKLNAQAQAEDKTAAAAATAPGIVLGTIGYMAPEQVRGQGADARSDIFSFGAVLYEMLAGRRAFAGDSAADVMSAILKEDPPELAGSQPPLAPALERIVRHCLEKEPKQRFQSASDVALYLSDLSTATTGSVSGMPAPIIPASRRRLGFAAVGSFGLLVAVGIIWTLANRPAPVPQFRKITYQDGSIGAARFLPDGQGVLAAAQWQSGLVHLFTQRLDSVGEQPFAAASDVLAVRAGQAEVIQHLSGNEQYTYTGVLAGVPLGGGTPRPVMDDVQFADYAPGRGDLAITRFHSNFTFTLEYPVGHVLVSLAGWIGNPRFSRDGRHIAFIEHPLLADDTGSVAVVDLQGHEKILTRRYASMRGLAWSPRDNEIWFSASDSTTLALHAVSLSGHDRLLLEGAGSLRLEDVFPDGRALVVDERLRQAVDLVTPQQPQPRDFTVLDWGIRSAISPDGQTIMVGDEDSGPAYSTYLRNPDGSPAARLGDGDPLAVSPDGQWVVSRVPTSQQLVLLPTGAGEARPLTHGAILYEDTPASWLPDGKGIVAEGLDPNHTLRIYWVSMEGTAKPVTPASVVGTVATADGRGVLAHLFFGGPWSLYPLAGGPPQPEPALKVDDTPLRFSGDGRTLFVSRRSPPDAGGRTVLEVWGVNLDSGQRQRLFAAAPDAAGALPAGINAISADGKTYTTTHARVLETLYVVTGLR